MSAATETFISFWRLFTPGSEPFAHPEDAASKFLADFELALLPVPFIGNLREAEAIILMLNPGLDCEDLRWEREPSFRTAVERNLRQSVPYDPFPNFYLNPAFEGHPGAGYWAKSRRIPGKRDLQKLNSVIHAVARRDGVTRLEAQKHVARKVAIVQLVPYHSAKLKRRTVLSDLPSVLRARTFVDGLVREKSKLVIAARSVSEWGFTSPINTDHLVVYKSTLGASASLTMRSVGGRALLARLSRTGT